MRRTTWLLALGMASLTPVQAEPPAQGLTMDRVGPQAQAAPPEARSQVEEPGE